ncbi:MAG: nuclear transport factor 2 family protein [Acidobacteriaceae bacterium]
MTNLAARPLVEDWIAAWNSHDLEWIMQHYAASVVFEANTVQQRWNRENGRLIGAEALREHFRAGLEKAPTLHFELEEVFTAPSGYAALYRRDNGNRVLDAVELDADGKAVAVKAYYMEEQT